MQTLPPLEPVVESDRVIRFIRQTFEAAHKTTAVIALSGGIDSALSLMLAAKALGPDHTHAYYLPSKTSSSIHQQDAQNAAAATGLPSTHFHTINIGSIIQKFWRIISHYSKAAELSIFGAQICEAMRAPQNTNSKPAPEGSRVEPDGSAERYDSINKLRLANLAARIRMLVIYDQAKKRNALVVGTENYSEHLLGYFTRFGDSASDLEPIGHLYKTQVIELAKFMDLPESIIAKPPSADLWPGQTDENELGFSYESADPILYLIDQGKTKEEIIAAGHPETVVAAVINQVRTSAFKHQVPYHL